MAYPDLSRVGTPMQTPLSARLPLEMLDCIGDIDTGAVHSGLRKQFIEQGSGGPDEGPAGPVFSVAGLLPHQHECPLPGAFTAYAMRCVALRHRSQRRQLSISAADGPCPSGMLSVGLAFGSRLRAPHVRRKRGRALSALSDRYGPDAAHAAPS